MGDNSTIEWTEATWNPTVGCSLVSEGCTNCYAERQSARQQHNPDYDGILKVNTAGLLRWSGQLNTLPDRLDLPIRWARPRRIFVNSMSDLFHGKVPPLFIAQCFAVMACAPHHTFQILTKRPSRMRSLLSSPSFRTMMVDATTVRWAEMTAQQRSRATRAGGPLSDRWPLPNVWLGTSIEDDRYSFRARHLRNAPAAVRFLSCEPLLGPLDDTLAEFAALDWIIAGGESGRGYARPMHPEWVRSIRDTCERLQIPFLFKQWGEWEPVRPVYDDRLEADPLDDYSHASLAAIGTGGAVSARVAPDGRHTGHQPPGDQDPYWMAAVGKKASGRTLDGRLWDEYPRNRLEAASGP